MGRIERESRCAEQKALNFHWFDGVARPGADPLRTAVSAGVDAVYADSKRPSMYEVISTESAIRRRIQKAVEGKLRSPLEVKQVGQNPVVFLYELRWQDLEVSEADSSSELGFKRVPALLRIYHAEPDSHPRCMIGHGALRKVIAEDGSHKSIQTAQIVAMGGLHTLGAHVNWGVGGSC